MCIAAVKVCERGAGSSCVCWGVPGGYRPTLLCERDLGSCSACGAVMTRKTVEITASVHKTMPACCRSAVLTFAAGDRYQGAGEPGDQISCPCGNALIYDYRGWRVAEDVARKVARL